MYALPCCTPTPTRRQRCIPCALLSPVRTIIGEPLTGHTEDVNSISCSPDGRHIISRSDDRTIRIWDAKTGVVVGNPLEGHTEGVTSVTYSPDGRHIISGSDDRTIRTWDSEAGTAAGNPLKGHIYSVQSIAYSSDGRHIISGSSDNTIRVWNAFPYAHTRTTPCNSNHPEFFTKPDMDGWVRNSEGGLPYWLPHEGRSSVHSPALMTIPLTSCDRSVSLNFEDIAFGTSWTQIAKNASS